MSDITTKAIEMMNEGLGDYGGLTPKGVQILDAFLLKMAGFKNYNLCILPKTDNVPVQIIIQPLDENGKKYYIYPKNKDILKWLAAKIGLTEGEVRFATLGECDAIERGEKGNI